MILKNKYAIGCHVMFYEIEMVSEYVDSCIKMSENIENKENLLFHFTFNLSEHFEKIDTNKINVSTLMHKIMDEMNKFKKLNILYRIETKTNEDSIYNIPAYRRDLNYNYCLDYDYVLWGESDCMWPINTFKILEEINDYCNQHYMPKHVITFSYRKMWDNSWLPVEHIKYKKMKFQKDKEWQENAKESPKSYMSYDEMLKINKEYETLGTEVSFLTEPKFDGSCLVISSELIKSGINIPHSLLLCSEDESFSMLCKKILGNEFRQVAIQNVLRIHNRRHPRKRNYVLNEENQSGYCDKKGKWWGILERMSKSNSHNLYTQQRFFTYEDFKKEMKKLNE